MLFSLPSIPLLMSPFVLLHSATVLLVQPLVWVLGPMIDPGPPPPPSGYSGVFGGVRRQDGSGFAVRGWCMVPFLLRLCVWDWTEGLSRPLSSPVSAVTSSPGTPERGLLWDGGNNSLCGRIEQRDFRSQYEVYSGDEMIRKWEENEYSCYLSGFLLQYSKSFVPRYESN